MFIRIQVCKLRYAVKYSGDMKRRTFLQLSVGLITGALGAITLSGLGPYRQTGTSASSKPSSGGQSGVPDGPDDGIQGGVDESPARPSNLEEPENSYEPRMTPIGDGVFTAYTYDRNGWNIIGKKTFRPDKR